MNKNTWLVGGIFIACDTVVLFAIFRMALFIRDLLTGLIGRIIIWDAIDSTSQLGILFCIGALFIQDLYPGYGQTTVKELGKMTKSISLAFFLLAAVSYLNKPFQSFSRSVLMMSWLLALISLPIVHFILRNLLSRTSWYGLPVIIFGESPWSEEIANSLHRVRRLGWRPITLLKFEDIPKLDRADKTGANIAILAPVTNAPVEDFARQLNQRYHKVILLRQSDHFGSLWVEPRDLDGYLGLEFSFHLLSWPYRLVKRLIDLVGSFILLIVLSPVFAILALCILVDSPGPVFFQQERIGLGSRHFKILKFRTMVQGAEEKLEQLLSVDPHAREEYEKYHKLEEDPRITRVGRFLRKFSLDELPQFWNVLIGDMSLTGPRAYLPSELPSIGTYASIILRVHPGVTGWWQVLGRHNTTFQQRLEMDEYYISNWSIWMDVYILLKTIPVALAGTGA